MEEEIKKQIKWAFMAITCFILGGFTIGGWFYISVIKVGSFFNWSLISAFLGMAFMILGLTYAHKLDKLSKEEDARQNKTRN